MTGAADPDRRAFLNCLFGAEPEPAFAELRYIRDGGRVTQSFHPVRDVAAIEALGDRAAPAANVFVGVGPRTRREGTRGAVERLHVVWVDVDGDREKLRAFRPLPSIVVASGGGVHAYWALRDPVGPDEAEAANRQLAVAVDADLRCVDAARILRLPGTLNHKTDPPRAVEILRCVPEIFKLEEIVGKLPAPADPSTGRDAGPRLARREFEDGADVLAAINPPTYFRLLTGADVPDRGATVRCPLPDHEDRTPSCHVYADAGAGWFCFGCGRGGSLIDLGAALWGIDPRGRGYHELRRRLAGELCGMAVPI